MTVVRREPRWPFPALTGWLGAPMPGLARFGPVIRIEDFVDEGRYVMRAELAGLDPAKDVEVHVGNGILTIKAERRERTAQRHRSEFRYGSFERTIRLPRGANEDDIKATFDNGVLEVSVGLAGGHPGEHRVTVQTGN